MFKFSAIFSTIFYSKNVIYLGDIFKTLGTSFR